MVIEITDGIGVDAALECVGTATVDRHRSSRSLGRVRRSASSGSPTVWSCRSTDMFFRNVGWHGGPAPARSYIPELMPTC